MCGIIKYSFCIDIYLVYKFEFFVLIVSNEQNINIIDQKIIKIVWVAAALFSD